MNAVALAFHFQLRRYGHKLTVVAGISDESFYRAVGGAIDNERIRGKGWYLENGVMSGVKSKALTRLVTRLCAEVSENAVALVDAFGIPDECLAAPIAL